LHSVKNHLPKREAVLISKSTQYKKNRRYTAGFLYFSAAFRLFHHPAEFEMDFQHAKTMID